MSAARLLACLALCAMALTACDRESSQDTQVAKGQSESVDAATVPTQESSPTPPAVRITQVRADRLFLDPDKKESTTVHFNIDEAAEVDLVIYDGRDRMVRRVGGGRLAPGDHRLSWDGRDAKGRAVPPEAYVYTLVAKASAGAPVVHDLTDLTGGEALTIEEPRWDPDTGQVHYHLDKPARVNIRFGLQDGGPYLRTLVDWVPRPAGAQVEAWDGTDASGVLTLTRHPMLAVGVMAYSLPDNVVLVGKSPDQVTFADLPEGPHRERLQAAGSKRMYFHADQPLDTRGDVSASLTINAPVKQDAEGRWVVSGRVPIRLQVADTDRGRVLARRFEPVFYVDGIFAFENEVGFLPMTWHWDTSTVNEGEHFVTVNVRGYEGNFGAATLKVWVQHPSKGSATGEKAR